MSKLYEFVVESNRIEGILREPTKGEMEIHEWFLALSADDMTTGALCAFVAEVAGKPIRDRPGLDVRVGAHRPPPGGPHIVDALKALLADAAPPSSAASEKTPYEVHIEYEWLHPFMDGNGRSGRALWAWMMLRDGRDPFALPFLHRWYYQSLDAART